MTVFRYMDIFKILILFLSLSSAYGQVDEAQFDSIRTVNNQHLLIYKNGKTGFYDLNSQQFLLDFTKDKLVHFQRGNLLAQLNRNAILLSKINGSQLDLLGIYSFRKGVFVSLLESESDSTQIIEINGERLIHGHERDTIDPYFYDSFYTTGNFDFLLLDKSIALIQHAYLAPLNFDRTLETSLNRDLNRSGVYDFKKKEWIIEPKYSNIIPQGDYIIATKYKRTSERDSLNDFFGWFSDSLSYDIYQKSNKKYDLVFADIDSINSQVFAKVLGYDSIRYKAKSHIYKVYNDGKMGFAQIDFQTVKNRPINFSFNYQELVPCKYHYGFSVNRCEQLIGFNAERIDLWSVEIDRSQANLEYTSNKALYYSKYLSIEEFESKDSCLVYIEEDVRDEEILVEQNLSIWRNQKQRLLNEPNIEVGIEFIGENKVLIHNSYFEPYNPFEVPIMSSVFPYEDSVLIDEDGVLLEVVYPKLDEYTRAGIYDLKKNAWQIANRYKSVYPTKYGVIAVGFDTLNEGLNYHFYNPEDSIKFKLLTSELEPDVLAKQVMLMDLGDETDTIVEYPLKTQYHGVELAHIYPGIYYPHQFNGQYYFVRDSLKKWQLYKPFNIEMTINPYALTRAVDFIHYNPSYGYVFWLENDELFIEVNGKVFNVDTSEPLITLNVQTNLESKNNLQYELIIRSEDGEVVHRSEDYDQQLKSEYVVLKMKDNELIINEPQTYDNYSNMDGSLYELEYSIDGFDYEDLQSFDIETSTIWRKENGVWEKKTTEYAMIEELPFGYLVKTGMNKRVVDLLENEFLIEPGKFILLNNELKAMGFFDFFDFEKAEVFELGLSLCTAQGCFFIDNNGQVVTNPEWDVFEVHPDGRLKALRYGADADYYLGWGEENEIFEKVEWFDLK